MTPLLTAKLQASLAHFWFGRQRLARLSSRSRPNPDAKTVIEMFSLNLTDCATCKHAELARTWAHDGDDHDGHDH